MDRTGIILETLIAALRARVDWFYDAQQECREYGGEDDDIASKADQYGLDVSIINLRDVAKQIDAALTKHEQR